MKARSKTNKVLDIILSEEKFYFPGETIQGSIMVKPKSSIKVNPIIIKFSGAIYISAKDKEVIPLFQTCKTILINDGKSKVLEPKLYSFPFEFLVPDNFPSAMDFGKNKTTRINYKLTVILDRPMMPESLCPKLEYQVSVMEYVDVTRDNFVKPLEKQKEVMTLNNGKCHAKLSVPRTGFTRGETVPVNIVVNTFQSFVKKESLVIDLIRKVKIQTSRNTLDEEHVLKSSKFDLNIIGPYNFSQSITSQILIPSTPPTIRYKDRVLRVHYKIRAQLFTEAKKTPNILLELPIVIGTWPRADVPIDDDDDDDIIQNMGELMISDAVDDDVWMRQQEELEFTRHSHSSFTLNNTPSPTSTISMKYSQSYYNTNNNSNLATATANANVAAAAAAVKRSGSNNSLGSVSSWRSQSTSDPRLSATTSPTSVTGSVLSNNTIPDYQRNTLGLKMTNGYLNRSSSTPDLLSNPPPTPSPTLQQNQSNNTRARVIDPTIRSSYYEPQINNSSGLSHRSTKSLHSIHHPPQQQHHQQQHRRIGSDEFNVSPTSSSSFSVSPIPQNNEPDVPSHTLMFLSSSTTQQRRASPPRIITQQRKYIDSLDETFDSGSYLDEDDDDDDDDEDEDSDEDSDDDLFAIIEKKKRREEKEQKKRQRMMYTLTE